jgi:hypothetical protein
MASRVRSSPSPALEGAKEVALLAHVAESRDANIQSLRAQLLDELADVGRAAHGHDKDRVRLKPPANPSGECLDRDPVAVALDEYGRAESPLGGLTHSVTV